MPRGTGGGRGGGKDVDSGSSSDESNGPHGTNREQKRVNFLAGSEDPRTLSQIRRSRIDLARRYVFLCPTSLNKHFDSLPHQAKDSALLVFRCSRNWLFADSKAVRLTRLQSKIDTGSPGRKPRATTVGVTAGTAEVSLRAALYRTEYSREFLQWVLTKEKEGCVFWYRPQRDLEKMSHFFEEKIDPVSEQPYRPLLLDPNWWRVKFQRASARYVGNPRMVVQALTSRNAENLDPRAQDIEIPTLQELIFQSNPSLEPISKWPHAPSMRFLPREPPVKKDFVGQDSKYKGYIDGGDSSRGLTQRSAEPARISKWPASPRERFDNLHALWQVEESSFTRRHCFVLHGMKTVSPVPGSAPGTAR